MILCLLKGLNEPFKNGGVYIFIFKCIEKNCSLKVDLLSLSTSYFIFWTFCFNMQTAPTVDSFSFFFFLLDHIQLSLNHIKSGESVLNEEPCCHQYHQTHVTILPCSNYSGYSNTSCLSVSDLSVWALKSSAPVVHLRSLISPAGRRDVLLCPCLRKRKNRLPSLLDIAWHPRWDEGKAHASSSCAVFL